MHANADHKSNGPEYMFSRRERDLPARSRAITGQPGIGDEFRRWGTMVARLCRAELLTGIEVGGGWRCSRWLCRVIGCVDVVSRVRLDGHLSRVVYPGLYQRRSLLGRVMVGSQGHMAGPDRPVFRPSARAHLPNRRLQCKRPAVYRVAV